MTERNTLRLGTRGSDLARTQSTTIADALRAHGVDVELEIISTAGDRSAAEQFSDIGPQGVFVREIESAVLDGRVDLAVHSYKDLPTRSHEDLIIGAVPTRFDVSDVLLIRSSALDVSDRFIPLKQYANVGTSSARRQSWLKHFRPDIELQALRGNVPTRIGRLRDGAYDAIILAAAGLDRLRAVESLLDPLLKELTIFPLSPDRFVPAPSQGALAVQCRRSDKDMIDLLAKIDHEESRACVAAERAALHEADGGCELAFGAYCTLSDNNYSLTCMLERNGQVHTVSHSATQADELGKATWNQLVDRFSA